QPLRVLDVEHSAEDENACAVPCGLVDSIGHVACSVRPTRDRYRTGSELSIVRSSALSRARFEHQTGGELLSRWFHSIPRMRPGFLRTAVKRACCPDE